jgi:hypothetical protein
MPEDEIYYMCQDGNNDGIKDTVVIYKKDWNIPLTGDYKGVELARIRYTASNPASVKYAMSIAGLFMKALIYEPAPDIKTDVEEKDNKFYLIRKLRT